MTHESAVSAPPIPAPSLAPNEIVPLLIGATVGEIERELVLQTLGRCDGNRNRTRAARVLGCRYARCATRSGSTPPMASRCPRITTSRARQDEAPARYLRRWDSR